jgi:Kdo2-lipid IVA lauroyltransferase/acyltransferase
MSAHQPVPGAELGAADWVQRGVMRGLSKLPLPWLRKLGWLLGWVLYAVVAKRRHIALTNWRLCFPELTERQRTQGVQAHFVRFAQAWLDRSWLWEAPEAVVAQRLRLVDDTGALAGTHPTVVFAPHFVGLDAGWTALTLHLPRRCCGLYAPQNNAVVDRWMVKGRQRFGSPQVVAKWQGLKALGTAIREGSPMYLLPDMDHGLSDGMWAPFFGVQAATLTSLPRLARLGRARVVAVTSRLTPQGYDVTVGPVWQGYPSDDIAADVACMNQELEQLVRTMPEQYYWVHKRFKTRPEGEPSPYAR